MAAFTLRPYDGAPLDADATTLHEAIERARQFVYSEQADVFAEPYVTIYHAPTTTRPIGWVDGDGDYHDALTTKVPANPTNQQEN